uniref:WD_REPEATS_REGION domain-containing protein n=1 Tax=Meloidogyne hapla TaxID=6305 RepID=A0A1I8BSL7_MELHA
MKILWESRNWPGASIEQSISCLSWAPSAKEGRGLLSVGCETGSVGVTYTDLGSDHDCYKRSFFTFIHLLNYLTLQISFKIILLSYQKLHFSYNFNLRGHQSSIALIAWNRAQTKLLSCDVNGVIYLWAPNEERWTVELVNDRGFKVRDFDWSPNGASALICYEDNFVLIGSSTGQRVWSNTFLFTILSGAWAPNSQELVLGLNSGAINVLNDQGTLIAERSLFQSADQILFLNTFYEVELCSWQAPDPVILMRWSNDGTMLAVVCIPNRFKLIVFFADASLVFTIFQISTCLCKIATSKNILKDYYNMMNLRIVVLDYNGRVIHSFSAPIPNSTLSAFTWAHNDQAIVIAAKGRVATGRILRNVPSLSQLASYSIWELLGQSSKNKSCLPLPERERTLISQFDHHIIRCRIPNIERLYDVVCRPSAWRWYCTIVPVARKNLFMLCVEHMGGFVPILLGRQTNRIIPQFIISFPPHLLAKCRAAALHDSVALLDESLTSPSFLLNSNLVASRSSLAAPVVRLQHHHLLVGGPSAQVEDVGQRDAFRRESSHRNSVWRRSKRQIRRFVNRRITLQRVTTTLSSARRTPPTLVHVNSNVWCTRFKINAASGTNLPTQLAQVFYKTSVLHLQPRQMTINLFDLGVGASTTIEPRRAKRECRDHRRCESAARAPLEVRSESRWKTRTAISDDELSEGDRMLFATVIAHNKGGSVAQRIAELNNTEEYPYKRMTPKKLQNDSRFCEGLDNECEDALLGEHMEEDGLMNSEREMYENVISEFDGLRQAVNTYIMKMKQFATELEQSQSVSILDAPSYQSKSFVNPSTSKVPVAPLNKERPMPLTSTASISFVRDQKRPVTTKIMLKQQNKCNDHRQSTSTPSTREFVHQTNARPHSSPASNVLDGWQIRLKDLEFIDDDDHYHNEDRLNTQTSTLPYNQNYSTNTPFSFSQIKSSNVETCTPLMMESSFHKFESIQLNPHDVVVDANSKNNSRVSHQLNDIRAVVDKLSRLASELSATRHHSSAIHSMQSHISQRSSTKYEMLEIKHASTGQDSPSSSCSESGASSTRMLSPSGGRNKNVSVLREKVRGIARHIAQFEELIRINDLLNEISGDLRQRVHHIKVVLGEDDDCEEHLSLSSIHGPESFQKKSEKDLNGLNNIGQNCRPMLPFAVTDKSNQTKSTPQKRLDELERTTSGHKVKITSNERTEVPGTPSEPKMLVMTNKRPFWNEQSQLDFNGRVTQESAKNFQIEYQNRQVLQFGRIENGAYTLDFREPFSAIQAFAIALASITQRLK